MRDQSSNSPKPQQTQKSTFTTPKLLAFDLGVTPIRVRRVLRRSSFPHIDQKVWRFSGRDVTQRSQAPPAMGNVGQGRKRQESPQEPSYGRQRQI
jgi:hypothetical protein